MEFFIRKNSTLPKLQIEVINESRFGYAQLDELLSASTITLSLFDPEKEVYKLVNRPATAHANDDGSGFFISYQFTSKETSKEGRYLASFKIVNDRGEYIVPVNDDLWVTISNSFADSEMCCKRRKPINLLSLDIDVICGDIMQVVYTLTSTYPVDGEVEMIFDSYIYIENGDDIVDQLLMTLTAGESSTTYTTTHNVSCGNITTNSTIRDLNIEVKCNSKYSYRYSDSVDFLITPTPTVTPTNTPTPSVTPTNTPTPSVTPTNTPTPSFTPTNTPTISNTPTNTPTISNTATNTPTASVTPSASVTQTPTQTVTQTQTVTMTPSATQNPTTTPTPTLTQTNTQTPTQTSTPGASLSPTPTMSQTNTQTPTPTPTFTQTQTQTPTPTPTPSATPRATETPTPTLTQTVTQTESPLPTSTPTITSTPTLTPSSSAVGVVELRRLVDPNVNCNIDASTIYYASNTLGSVSADYIKGTDGFCYLVLGPATGTINLNMLSGPFVDCIDCDVTPAGAFVGDFVQGVAPTQEVIDNWVSFRQSLTGTYSQFTWSSTNGNSITVSGPEVQQLADGLRNETAVNVNINGTNWLVGIGCTAISSITAVELSNVSSCSASSTYALRPQIGNNNWGGTNESTVNAPTQTITLTFS